MSGAFRLDWGGAINRSRPLNFSFDGRTMSGFEGDTLASALLACGVSTVGRSFKFHRPRGILTAGPEEPNALVTVGEGARREPNVRATTQPLFAGLVAHSQNCWPTLDFDAGRINDWLHPLLPAGFYNKMFKWPSWHAFEPAIRRMAGLGRVPEGPDPDRYECRNAHCDVVVVGAGAAGLRAAEIAAQAGARVILIESSQSCGGRRNWDRASEGAPSPAVPPTVRLLLRTTAVGVYDHGLLAAVERPPSPCQWRERWWRIRARQIILACGAFEQPLVFPDNDRPGILLADAARQYLNRYAVAVGTRVVIATNNDSAYVLARDLQDVGIEIPCVLETRSHAPEDEAARCQASGIEVVTGSRIVRTTGSPHVASVLFRADGQSTRRIACDALAMSGGWNPVSHLYCQAGGKLRFDPAQSCLAPDGALSNVHAIGAAAGQFDADTVLEDVGITLANVLVGIGRSPRRATPERHKRRNTSRLAPGAPGCEEVDRPTRAWVDFQHDVTVADIELAVRESMISVEHLKRYTTVGMAIDQGKTSNLNALAILAARTGRSIPEVGTTTFRPMFVPVTLGAIAGGRNGRFYSPTRRLPAHVQHERLGAHFEDYSGWQRPACYPRAGESLQEAIVREMQAVRSAVGIYDASPLGKVMVRGPDAAIFLDRLYATSILDLREGCVRYALLLNEQGVIMDDGIVARLAPDEFFINTTSAGAVRSIAWLDEWLQCEWPQLRLALTDCTSAWATITIAGPHARALLREMPTNIDLGAASLPHMRIRTGQICGIPCRLLRVSFSGELSYEVSVPADFGASLWEALMRAGQRHGITPFGVESLNALRTEKGYLHVGADTDGSTIPDDVGFGLALSRKVGDFVGRRSLSLPENVRGDRLQLIGLRCLGDPSAFRPGAHLLDHLPPEPQSVTGHAGPAVIPTLGRPLWESGLRKRSVRVTSGYLTSAVFSPASGCHIGLGRLRSGRSRLGETIAVYDGGRYCQAKVVDPVHYDPEGRRLRG